MTNKQGINLLIRSCERCNNRLPFYFNKRKIIMSENINEVANNLLKKFEIRTSEDGENLVIYNDEGHFKNFIREVHGQKFSCDFVYQTIYNCIESISNNGNDINCILEDVTPDTHLDDLIKWSVRQSRIHYINDVLSEYHPKNYSELLHVAQVKEIEEICIQTLGYLVTHSH